MLCTRELCHSKQHIIVFSHTSTTKQQNYYKVILENIHSLLELHHHMLCLHIFNTELLYSKHKVNVNSLQ